jgi:plasmid stabilization system protein ParE
MPSDFVLTRLAVDDLDNIWNYIARDSQDAANRVESAVFSGLVSLARHPLIGSKRSDLTPLPVRFWPIREFPSYIVVYRPETRPLEIVAILHGKREISRLLEARGLSYGNS